MSLHLQKFLTTFLAISPNAFISKLLSGCPPFILDARGRHRFLSSILSIYPYFLTFAYTFFQKTPSLDAPGLMPRAVAPTPAPPLHATGKTLRSTQTAKI